MRRKLALAVLGGLVMGACSASKRVDTEPAAVHIVATDSGYVAPDTLHEGLNHLVFENRGTTIHECMFVRLPDGMSARAYLDAVEAGYAFPEGAIDCSGPGLTSPMQRFELWVPLEAGTYLLACWFTGHLTTTEPRTVVVHGAPRVAVTPPREDVTLKLIDFRFELIGEIETGPQTIRVEAAGPSMHEVDIFHLQEGRSVDVVRAWYASHQRGSLPATLMGGVLDSHEIPSEVWLRREFAAGRHVLWCGMPMIQSGKESDAGAAADVSHADAGMVLEFDVGK
ncbi:MAG TPA: hypothetical protein VEC56_04750 [Candidatus Krumholzibacteria bacterium]|nr:hypothetical protein [Candidatus Krumholzibacteria bacterium]